jgi:dolichyl-phosphate-mannose-protein mannosyltransferase
MRIKAWQWRRTMFWLAAGLFVTTRLATLLSFPIFNDEAIYLQYSQFIHDDFRTYKFISMNNIFQDWKPPLQYWLGSTVVQFGNNPVLMGRLVAFAISVLGFFGMYLLSRRLFGKTTAVWSILIYALCPPVLFYNNQFVAETFVFSTIPFFYWFVLRAITGDHISWSSSIGASICGAIVLLFKQSALPLLVLGLVLPFVQPARRQAREDAKKKDKNRPPAVQPVDYSRLGTRFALVGLIIIASTVISRPAMPAAYDQIKNNFDARWTLSFTEVLHLPTSIWLANSGVVGNYFKRYYTLWTAPLLLVFAIVAIRRRSAPDIVFGLMFLAASSAVLFFVKSFNEYIYNTEVIVFLVPMLARGILFGAQQLKPAALRFGTVAITVVLLASWGYQLVLMRVDPGKYIMRGSPWMVSNYLQNWSTGFGINMVVDYLGSKDDGRRGVVFTDPQWGNPQTALQVFAKSHYPHFQVSGITAEFTDEAQIRKLRDERLADIPHRFLVYSAATDSERAEWQKTVQVLCDRRQQFRENPAGPPLIVCEF